MKNFQLLAKFFVLAFLFISVSLFAGGGDYTPLNQKELSSFAQALSEQIKIAEDRVQKILLDMSRSNHIISNAEKIDLENAKTMLNVKMMLIGKFEGSESLRSQLVRDKLLSVLKKETITMSDMFDLQTLTTQEQTKISLQDNTSHSKSQSQ